MAYDTLILSGGSVKGCALLGSFKYLIDREKINIKKLKHIISASVGALMALPLILKVSIHAFYKIIKETRIKLFEKEDFKIENVINEYGIYDNSVTELYVKTFIKHILKKDIITLKELFNLTEIKYTVKVSNITKNKVEYINYLNYPDLDITTLIKMTTSIPIVFKPVKYNDCLYCDGATGGGLPIEYNKSKNYLGIMLYPFDKDYGEIKNILDYLKNLVHVYNTEDDFNKYKKYKNIICIDLKRPIKLDITEEEKEEFFIEGYKQTKAFFE